MQYLHTALELVYLGLHQELATVHNERLLILDPAALHDLLSLFHVLFLPLLDYLPELI